MIRVFKKFKDLLDVSWSGSEGKFWKTKADGSGLEAVAVEYSDLEGEAAFGSSTDKTVFEADGTMVAYGSATSYSDLQGGAVQLKSSGPGVSLNSSENTLEFTTLADLNDYAYDVFQLQHTWKIGTNLSPHIHWEQNQNATPNWLFQYRWQEQGGSKTTAWTNIPLTHNAFTYTSGVLNQITTGADIIPPVTADLSDMIQIRLVRDNSNTSGLFLGTNTYTGTASIHFIDIHYNSDTLGSRLPFTK